MARRPTARFRSLPDFLVIGAQRGGTSSLYRYLGAHPQIAPSLRKETEYLSRRQARGENWYRTHFPLKSRLRVQRLILGMALTFEATPDYLFHPYASERAAELLPNAKFVVLLRNPTERAFSHYRHMVRLGFETLSFEEALEAETARLAGDLRILSHDPDHNCRDLLRFSYVARGRYLEQLERWWQRYERNRFFILSSEELFGNPARSIQGLSRFLGLKESWRPTTFVNASYRRGGLPEKDRMLPETRSRLEHLFGPENARLYEAVGMDFGWDEVPRVLPPA